MTEFVTQCNVTNYNVSESKAESYKTTHNFFFLEDGRSNSLLQTYKLLILQEIEALKNRIPVMEQTEVEMVVLM